MLSNSLSTSTLDSEVLASIRQAIVDFLRRCGLQYTNIMIDEVSYSECCQEAINRGFPMDGKYSLCPYMAAGVAMFNTFAHLPDRATYWCMHIRAICVVFLRPHDWSS
ncbi:hypothetical protein EDB19DRAFT_1917111 [Suillus lakei]|nr:hypothetical protein EDB19DRAFT_1917111 [Suillus lakei]